MIRLSPSRSTKKAKPNVKVAANISWFKRIFSPSAVKQVASKAEQAAAKTPAELLESLKSHIKVPELKQSLTKVHSVDSALKNLENPHNVLKEIHPDFHNLPQHHIEKTKYVLYDPAHPFDVHHVKAEDIKFLAERNPEYLAKHLHIYNPTSAVAKTEELTREAFKKPGFFESEGKHYVIGGKKFTRPTIVLPNGEKIDLANKTIIDPKTGQVTQLGPEKIDKLRDVLSKRGIQSFEVVEGVNLGQEGHSLLPEIGTAKASLITGSRPGRTFQARAESAGGLLPSFLMPWKLSPATKMYFEKLKAGRFGEIPLGQHFYQGLLDIGMGRVLPAYLIGSGLYHAATAPPGERMQHLAGSITAPLWPAMYSLSMPAWMIFDAATRRLIPGASHAPLGIEPQAVAQGVENIGNTISNYGSFAQ